MRVAGREAADDRREGGLPGVFFFAAGDDAKNVTAEFGVGEAFPHRVQLAGSVGHGLVHEKPGVSETGNSVLQLNPGTLSGGDQTRFGLQSGDALECDPIQRGVIPDKTSDDLGADRDEVRGGIVGLRQFFDVLVEELEGGLGERRDEPVFGPEEAVDGTCGGPGLIGHGPHRQRVRTTVGNQAFRGGT